MRAGSQCVGGKIIAVVVVLACGLAGSPGAFAARAVDSVTVNTTGTIQPSSPPQVLGNGPVSITMTVTTNGAGTLGGDNDDWEAIAYSWDGGATWTCTPIQNPVTSAGTHTDTFFVRAPVTPGTYNLTVRAHASGPGGTPVCSDDPGHDGQSTVAGAIEVIAGTPAHQGLGAGATFGNLNGGGTSPSCSQILAHGYPRPTLVAGVDVGNYYDTEIRYGHQRLQGCNSAKRAPTTCPDPPPFDRSHACYRRTYVRNQSGLGFEGDNEQSFSCKDKNAFPIGLFTHFNNPIYANTTLTSFTMELTVYDNNRPTCAGGVSPPGGGLCGTPIHFDPPIGFTFDETPNSASPCKYLPPVNTNPNPNTPPCDDLVKITTPSATQDLLLDDNGQMCHLVLLGFGKCATPRLPGQVQLSDEYYTTERTRNDTCLWLMPGNPVPVSLSSVRAVPEAGGVRFEWTTSSESETIGFNLWGRTGGRWYALNRRPVKAGSTFSVAPRTYRKRVGTAALPGPLEAVGLSSIDTDGSSDFYGPFELGERYGDWSMPEPIPWKEIRVAMAAGMEKAGYRRARSGWVRGGARSAHLRTNGVIVRDHPVADLRVAGEGVVRVTYEELQAAGVNLAGVQIRDIAVTAPGGAAGEEPVARWVKGTRGWFGPGGHITFRAEAVTPREALYTGLRTYRVVVDRALVKNARVQRDSATAGDTTYEALVEVDRNEKYSPAMPNGDPWYEADALAMGGASPAPVEMTFTFEVKDLVPDTPAQLLLGLVGVTNLEKRDFQQYPGLPANPLKQDHHVQVFVNSGMTPVADEWSDGLVDWKLEIPLASGVLREGKNTITVRVPGDTGYRFDMVAVDRYGAKYRRHAMAVDNVLAFSGDADAYEVGGFDSRRIDVYASRSDGSLVRIEGLKKLKRQGKFAVRFKGVAGPADYFVTAAGYLPAEVVPVPPAPANLLEPADYLIISHPAFLGAASLAEYAAAKEAEGYTVKLVNVDDLYTHYGHGMPVPGAIRAYLQAAAEAFDYTHVLLIGAATTDARNYGGSDSVNFVPTPFTLTNRIFHFSPADSLLADLDGDRVPDKSLGRWPVRTVAELDTIVKKTADFVSSGLQAEPSALLVADKRDNYGFDFAWQARAVGRELAEPQPDGAKWPWQDVQHLNLADYDSVAAAQDDLKAAIDAGVAATIFSGHGATDRWTFDGLFNWQTAQELTNAGKPTLITTLACYTTDYVSPVTDTLGHELLLGGDRGAVAINGSAVLSDYAENGSMAYRVTRYLVQEGKTLGEAIRLAKQELGGNYQDVVISWTLTGDPTLRLDPANVLPPPVDDSDPDLPR